MSTPQSHSKPRWTGLDLVIVLALMLALIAGSLVALPGYGIGWDEGLGDLFFGHRNLERLRGDATAAVLEARHTVDGDGGEHPDLFLSPLRNRPWEHWPVMATLSAASCQLLARSLRLLDPVDAHHLAGVFVLALLLPLLYAAAHREWARTGAIAACLTLVLHPRMLAAAWVDLKDTGSACFVTATLLLLHDGICRSRARSIVAAGLTTGLALGTKANILFAPLPLILFYAIARPSLPAPSRRTVAAVAAAAVLALAVLYGSWPWLREDPVEHLRLNLSYVAERASAGSPWPNPWPTLVTLASWPLGTLPLIAAGAWLGVAMLRERRSGLAGFALLGAVLPLARITAPGVVSFDGFRHSLELLPSAALLVGAGAHWLRSRVRVAPTLLVAALLLEPAVEVIAVHPHEIAHFSPLVGGISGARRVGFPQVEDYWATGYRRGLAWIVEHGEPGAAVAAGVAEHVLFIEGPFRLDRRPLVRASSPFRVDPGEQVVSAFFAYAERRTVYLMYVTREGWYGPIVRVAERRTPVYAEGPDGAPMLKIVRFGPHPESAQGSHR